MRKTRGATKREPDCALYAGGLLESEHVLKRRFIAQTDGRLLLGGHCGSDDDDDDDDDDEPQQAPRFEAARLGAPPRGTHGTSVDAVESAGPLSHAHAHALAGTGRADALPKRERGSPDDLPHRLAKVQAKQPQQQGSSTPPAELHGAGSSLGGLAAAGWILPSLPAVAADAGTVHVRLHLRAAAARGADGGSRVHCCATLAPADPAARGAWLASACVALVAQAALSTNELAAALRAEPRALRDWLRAPSARDAVGARAEAWLVDALLDSVVGAHGAGSDHHDDDDGRRRIEVGAPIAFSSPDALAAALAAALVGARASAALAAGPAALRPLAPTPSPTNALAEMTTPASPPPGPHLARPRARAGEAGSRVGPDEQGTAAAAGAAAAGARTTPRGADNEFEGRARGAGLDGALAAGALGEPLLFNSRPPSAAAADAAYASGAATPRTRHARLAVGGSGGGVEEAVAQAPLPPPPPPSAAAPAPSADDGALREQFKARLSQRACSVKAAAVQMGLEMTSVRKWLQGHADRQWVGTHIRDWCAHTHAATHAHAHAARAASSRPPRHDDALGAGADGAAADGAAAGAPPPQQQLLQPQPPHGARADGGGGGSATAGCLAGRLSSPAAARRASPEPAARLCVVVNLNVGAGGAVRVGAGARAAAGAAPAAGASRVGVRLSVLAYGSSAHVGRLRDQCQRTLAQLGCPVSQAAREMGVEVTSVRRWMRGEDKGWVTPHIEGWLRAVARGTAGVAGGGCAPLAGCAGSAPGLAAPGLGADWAAAGAYGGGATQGARADGMAGGKAPGAAGALGISQRFALGAAIAAAGGGGGGGLGGGPLGASGRVSPLNFAPGALGVDDGRHYSLSGQQLDEHAVHALRQDCQRRLHALRCPVSQAAREMGVEVTSVRRWMRGEDKGWVTPHIEGWLRRTDEAARAGAAAGAAGPYGAAASLLLERARTPSPHLAAGAAGAAAARAKGGAAWQRRPASAGPAFGGEHAGGAGASGRYLGGSALALGAGAAGCAPAGAAAGGWPGGSAALSKYFTRRLWELGLSDVQAAQQMGLQTELLSRWLRLSAASDAQALVGGGHRAGAGGGGGGGGGGGLTDLQARNVVACVSHWLEEARRSPALDADPALLRSIGGHHHGHAEHAAYDDDDDDDDDDGDDGCGGGGYAHPRNADVHRRYADAHRRYAGSLLDGGFDDDGAALGAGDLDDDAREYEMADADADGGADGDGAADELGADGPPRLCAKRSYAMLTEGTHAHGGEGEPRARAAAGWDGRAAPAAFAPSGCSAAAASGASLGAQAFGAAAALMQSTDAGRARADTSGVLPQQHTAVLSRPTPRWSNGGSSAMPVRARAELGSGSACAGGGGAGADASALVRLVLRGGADAAASGAECVHHLRAKAEEEQLLDTVSILHRLSNAPSPVTPQYKRFVPTSHLGGRTLHALGAAAGALPALHARLAAMANGAPDAERADGGEPAARALSPSATPFAAEAILSLSLSAAPSPCRAQPHAMRLAAPTRRFEPLGARARAVSPLSAVGGGLGLRSHGATPTLCASAEGLALMAETAVPTLAHRGGGGGALDLAHEQQQQHAGGGALHESPLRRKPLSVRVAAARDDDDDGGPRGFEPPRTAAERADDAGGAVAGRGGAGAAPRAAGGFGRLGAASEQFARLDGGSDARAGLLDDGSSAAPYPLSPRGGTSSSPPATPQRRGKPWSLEEDATLRCYVEEHGARKWSRVAQQLPGRTGKQCRERWCNQLNTGINRGNWSAEEDNTILHAHREIGNCWARIARLLPGRTDNQVKNRWNSTLAKRSGLPGSGSPPAGLSQGGSVEGGGDGSDVEEGESDGRAGGAAHGSFERGDGQWMA